MTSGAIGVVVGRVPEGWVAQCECGYRTKPMASKGLLAVHVQATFPEHIRESHLNQDHEDNS